MSTKDSKKWVNLSAAYLALVGGFVAYTGWTPSLARITEDLQLGYAEAGSLSSVTAIVAGAMTLIGGFAATRWSAKSVVLWGLAAGVVGLVLFSLAGGYSLAITGRAISGIAVGFLFVGTYTLAAEWFRGARETDRAMGIMLTVDGTGMFLSLFGFAVVLSAVGWRMGLMIEAGFLLIALPIVFFFAKTAPAAQTAPTHSSEAPHRTRANVFSSLNIIRQRNVFLTIAFWTGTVGTLALISTWMPSILVEQANWSESTAGLLTSLFSVIGMATAFFAASIVSMVGSRKKVIVAAAVGMTVALGALTLSLGAENYVLAAVFMSLLGLGTYAGATLMLAQAIESVSAGQAGMVNGLVIGIPWITSGFLFPYALGAFKDATGSFTGGFIAATLAAVILCVIPAVLLKSVPAVDTVKELDLGVKNMV